MFKVISNVYCVHISLASKEKSSPLIQEVRIISRLLRRIVQSVYSCGGAIMILEGSVCLVSLMYDSGKSCQSLKADWHGLRCHGLVQHEYLALSVHVEDKYQNPHVACAPCPII